MDGSSQPDLSTARARPTRQSSWVKKVLRDPLLHFLVLGALIFVADWATRSDANNARVIVVDDKVRNELTAFFRDGQGRDPTESELKVLTDRWVYNEVMYREALALGLDKGDEMFRSRLELKLRSMLIDNVVVDPPTDDDLRKWLDANRERYSAPRRFDFVQFQVEGSDSEAHAKAVALASQLKGDAVPAEYDEEVRIYRDRSQDNIASVFGSDFATGLIGGAGGWVALHSNTGWHVARMLDDKPPVEADFKAIKPQLEAEWRKAQQNRLAAEAFHRIRDRYDIRIENPS